MSFYQHIAKIGTKLFKRHTLFQYGFNLSPMYRRSTGRITQVSPDLYEVKIKLPLSYKNRNYVNSIFGGSMFSAVDPIPMVQLINILGDKYIVWDKSAQVYFKRPARTHLYATFTYTEEELTRIKQQIAELKEIEIQKNTLLTDKSGEQVYCEVRKIIFIADKAYFKEKSKKRKAASND